MIPYGLGQEVEFKKGIGPILGDINLDKIININPVDGKNVNKSLIDTRKKIKYQIPSYDVMVKEMIENVKSNISLYQYNELKP